MTEREEKLAADYVKCRSDILAYQQDYEIKIADLVGTEWLNDFYYYDVAGSNENVCRCQNGKAVTGTDCEAHNQEKCDPLKCNPGFHYELNHCLKNICEKGFYMTEEAKNSANPVCKPLFKGHDYHSVGSTGVYYTYENLYIYNLAEAHQFCKNLNANLGTIRDRVELGVIKSFLTDHVWIDVFSLQPSSNRAEWYWGNNGGRVSIDDAFWMDKRPIVDRRAGNKGFWYQGDGISNYAYDGINSVFGVLCEIRIIK